MNIIVIQLLSSVRLCDPMDCSTPGLPDSQYLTEFAQTHVHWVNDAIQPSHPLSPPSPAFSLSQHQGLFPWVSSLHQVAKVLELQVQHQSFQRIFRVDLLAVQGTHKSLTNILFSFNHIWSRSNEHLPDMPAPTYAAGFGVFGIMNFVRLRASFPPRLSCRGAPTTRHSTARLNLAGFMGAGPAKSALGVRWGKLESWGKLSRKTRSRALSAMSAVRISPSWQITTRKHVCNGPRTTSLEDFISEQTLQARML